MAYSSQNEPANVSSIGSGGWINSDPTASATVPQEAILSGRFAVSLISRLQSSPSDVVGWGRISETRQSLDLLCLTVGQGWDNFSNNNLPSEFKELSPVTTGCQINAALFSTIVYLFLIRSCVREVQKHPPDTFIWSIHLAFILKCTLFLWGFHN